MKNVMKRYANGTFFCFEKLSLTSVQYGRVERVFIHRESDGPIPVFVKFTAQLSALRVSHLYTSYLKTN